MDEEVRAEIERVEQRLTTRVDRVEGDLRMGRDMINERLDHHSARLEERKEQDHKIEIQLTSICTKLESLSATLKSQRKIYWLILTGFVGIITTIISAKLLGVL